LEGGPDSPRAGVFIGTLESAVAAHICGSPQQMTIPLAALVLVKQSKAL
jgi:hypothetical protein